jgi:hypothetical protein
VGVGTAFGLLVLDVLIERVDRSKFMPQIVSRLGGARRNDGESSGTTGRVSSKQMACCPAKTSDSRPFLSKVARPRLYKREDAALFLLFGLHRREVLFR